jgi:antitoxin PrlF
VAQSNFSVEAIVSCDERGQLVLPKDVRKKLDIKSGDKLALLNVTTKNNAICITLIKANSLEDIIKNYLSPMMKDITE